jgi:putative ABC transport system permease protein
MQRVVSPDYFRALGLRLAEGRVFTDADTMTAREVIVVNRSFAAKYLGPRPLGAIVPNLGMCRGDNDRWEVVGVVDDMRQGSVADAPQPELFMPYAQVGCAAAVPDPIVVIRTDADPMAHAATLRAVVRQEAPTLALDSLMTMDERVMNTLAKPRLYAVVLVGFGAVALAIAGVGLFGVLSYSVSLRSREISVRTALGARPRAIVSLVLRQVGVIFTSGIMVGVWTAYFGSRWLTSVLHGVDPRDPVAFALVPVILAAVTLLACIVPARRAARLDPARVLRAG